ncbi:MAG: AI-2E family transporter [Pseudomonadota bacterium]
MAEHQPNGHEEDDAPADNRIVHRVEIAPRTILAVTLTIGAVYLLDALLPILVVVVIALMLVGTLSPSVRWFQQRGLSRALSIAVVFLGCGVVVVGTALITIPDLLAQVTRTINQLPQIQQSLADILEAHRLTAPAASAIRNFKPEDRIRSVNANAAITASLGVVEVIGYAGTSIVLAIYFIADVERTRGALYAVVPRRYHVRLARVLLNLGTIVGGYLRGQVVTSVMIGIFTFGLLSVTRVPNALALGAFAAVTDVIPFVGGLLATTPAVLVALSRGTGTATVVLVTMILYQELESRIIVPRVYGQALRLSSAVVVIALLVGGKLGGIVGALLALPIAAAVRMLIEELRVDLPGDDTDDRRLRARDARAERLYARETAGASPEEAAAVAIEIANRIRQRDAAEGKDPAATPLTTGKE